MIDEILLPSQLDLGQKPELVFFDKLGLNSAEYVLGVLMFYCRDYNGNSFNKIQMGRYFSFLMNYEKSELPLTHKLKGLRWLLNHNVIVSERSAIILPPQTMNFIQDFRIEPQVQATLSAHR